MKFNIKDRLFSSDSNPVVSPLFKTSLVLTVFNILSRTIGLLIPILIARWYGVSGETDAFFFGYSIILSVTGIFSAVAESVIVPYIAELRTVSEEQVRGFLEEITIVAAGIIITLTALIILTIAPLLSIATKFSAEEIDAVRQILLEASLLPVIVLFASLYAGTLNAYHRYGTPVLSQALRSVVAIVVILFFRESFGIHAIVAGYVLGEMCRLVLVAGLAHRYRVFSFSFRIRMSKPLKAFFSVASFHVFSMLAMGLTPVTDKFVSSWLPLGSVSVMEYANKLYFIPVTFATSGFTVVLLSHWSGKQHGDPTFNLWADAQKASIVIGLAGVAIAVLSFFVAPVVVETFMNLKVRANMYSWQVLVTFRAYLLGLAPYLLSQVYVRGLLVMKQTKNIFFIAVVLNVTNLIFDIVFMNMVGVWGIALSTSLVSVLSWILHLRALRSAVQRTKGVLA